MDDCRLHDGSTVVIIGGGPGGSACAIRLLQGADARGLRLRVLIFEGKDFNVHANQCVGVLSPPIEEVLARDLDMHLPPSLIKRQIFGYRLHGARENVLLTGHGAHAGEPGHGRATYAVERAHFDGFMLDRARELGAQVIESRVTGVEFVREDKLDEVRVYSESLYERADVVIGAFGLDEAMLSVFEDVTRAYRVGFKRPSKWLKSYLTTIEATAHFQSEKLGHIVHAFLLPQKCPRIEFGAITPKGDHILVNIAGERVSSCDLDLFLQMPEVRALLPAFDPGAINYYEGRFPSAPARGAYGHRYALVGDATGWLRPFKGKGINTAIITGQRAAETILEHGVSKRALSHYRRSCNELLGDYRYGVIVRHMMLMGARLCLDPMIDVGKTDPVMYDALFDAVSGHDSYRNIIRRSFKPRLIRKVAARMIGGVRRHRAWRARRSMQDFVVRKMTVRDIDEVLRIDEKITGKPHSAYYQSKAAAYVARAPEYCLVAEHAGRVVGFVLGDVRGWEFATALSGWLEIVGVDPDYHGQGVSRALMNRLFESFRRAGVRVVNTMVNWNDGDLIDYFRANGFDRGEYVNLVKQLDEGTKDETEG